MLYEIDYNMDNQIHVTEISNKSQIHRYLEYCLPEVCTISLIITSINLWILLQNDLRRRPSHFIYTNMLLLDLITIAGGICIEISISTHGKVSDDADDCFDIIYHLKFYSGVTMLLGLGVCRVLSLKTSATFYVEFGIKLANGFVISSWFLGFIISILRKTLLQTSEIMVVSNLALFVLLSLSTIVLNLYILVKIILARERISQETYRQASKTALLLFMNAAIWNTVYVIRCIVFLVNLATTGEMGFDCSNLALVWRILLCGFVKDQEARHVVEIMFLAESLGNNLILITQPESRVMLKYVWRQFRDAVSQRFNTNHGYEQICDE